MANPGSGHGYEKVSISFGLKPDTNIKLTESAARASRTKRQEASLRLSDHLILFPDLVVDDKRFPLLSVNRGSPLVSINFMLDGIVNKKLSESANRSGRTKRDEAALRLSDHLYRFTDIAAEGKRFHE